MMTGELYGINLVVSTNWGPMVIKVPGWINFGVLRYMENIKPKIRSLNKQKKAHR